MEGKVIAGKAAPQMPGCRLKLSRSVPGTPLVRPNAVRKLNRPQGRKSLVSKATAEQTEGPRVLPSHSPAASTLGVILGGGAGSRLYPLTKGRAKPAVPIGGAYRLIDVPMSNLINSNINKIYILTQFNSTSLNRHLARTYNFGGGTFGGQSFVEVLAASQTPDQKTGKDWFKGTADAVRQYAWVFEDIKNRNVENIVILSGDHLYRMDYMDFVNHHRESDADITVGALPVGYDRASDFGLMKIDQSGRIVEFSEKPKGDALEKMRVDTTILGLDPEAAQRQPFIGSMGIYVFRKEVMLDLLMRDKSKHDFGGEIIPMASSDYKVMAYLFDGYWEDIGTIRSFFDANLALTENPPSFPFFHHEAPIYTSPRFLPPAKLIKCHLKDAIVSQGSYLRESTVEHAIIGIRSRIESGCTIKNAMVMGADYYESTETRKGLRDQGRPPIGVGPNSHLENVIVDKNARIGADVHISNKEGVEESNREEDGFYIRSGVVVVLKNCTIPQGTVI